MKQKSAANLTWQCTLRVNRAWRQAAIPWFSLLLFLLAAITAPCPAGAGSPRLEQQLDRLIANGGYILNTGGHGLIAKNQNTPFNPASTLKIVTALGALHMLGEDYRFHTDFYLVSESDLAIRGYGDPLLTSEEIVLILQALQRQGVTRINRILLDASAFQLEQEADGRGESLNPYDAAASALAVNFNTVNFIKQPDGSITSAEAQTPTLPIMRRLGQRLPPGAQRINLTGEQDNILIHTGELFRALQHKLGMPGYGAVVVGAVPAGARLLLTHRSTQSLEQVISGLLRYSNNYTANQIFLTCGAVKYGYPATWEKGQRAFREFLDSLGIGSPQLAMVEGSGLSRHDFATPAAMLRVLSAFQPYARLLHSDQRGRLIKSGTLTGVYCYAGYFTGSEGLNPFVVMLNQPQNRRDQLVDLLETSGR